MVTAAMKLKDASSLEEKLRHLDSILKSRDITLLTEVCIIKAMVFPVVMYRCESWTIKKAESQRLDTFEMWCWRRLETPLDSKEIQPVNPKGNQHWLLIGRIAAEAETPIFWPPDAKSWLIRKDPDAEKDKRQKEKGVAEDKMVRQHHWLNGHESEQTLGDNREQGSWACHSPQGCRVRHDLATEQQQQQIMEYCCCC